MDPYDPRPKQRSEKNLSDDLRKYMHRLGWHTEKFHGSVYQMGIPDLLAMHTTHGHRWIETKRPNKGRLTKAQLHTFPKWTRYGVGIWIITDVREYPLLFGPPNWWAFAGGFRK